MKHNVCCPICEAYYSHKNPRTHHHVLPKRFFMGAGETIELCRQCHNELEKLIPAHIQLEIPEYRKIVQVFIKNKRGQ